MKPRFRFRLDPTRLAREDHFRQFNCSLVRFRGTLILAYRTGWRGSRLHIAELSEDFSILQTRELRIESSFAVAGAEDPRLFVHQEKLLMSFAGITSVGGKEHAHVLLASFGPGLEIDRVWYPHFAQRTPTEKNWVFFGHEELFAVYSSAPEHVVLRVTDKAEVAYRTPTRSSWTGGGIRGGCPPVRLGTEWYHFFHGWINRSGTTVYSIGVLTFSADPPFPVLRMTRGPIQTADLRMDPKTPGTDRKAIIFPCGAVLRGDRWLVSYGHHDQFCEISEFLVSEIEDSLEWL